MFPKLFFVLFPFTASGEIYFPMFPRFASREEKKDDVEFSIIITVINNSTLPLVPTAEGVSGGCIGGSIPNPIALMPGHTQNVTIFFVNYLDSCRFNLLPAPVEVTALNGCMSVHRGDT